MNILLTALLVVNLALFVLICYVFVRVSRTIKDKYQTFIDFITPPGKDEPSALALTVSNMSDVLARSLIAQVKGYLMGLQSGAVRGENAEALETAIDVAGTANPLIGAVANIPGVKKLLRKNPGLLDLAIQQFMKSRGPGSGPGPGPSNGHTNNHIQTTFKL